jgi:ribonuclease HI
MGYEGEGNLREESIHEIYVDGSFIDGRIGYGAVVLKDGKVVDELCGAVGDPSAGAARQVAGELFAVEEALRWCKKNSVAEVSIFFDYTGIEGWATGRWKANLPLTKNYREFVRASGVRVRWRKVYSHTGDRWNDRADALAKTGALAGAKEPASPASDRAGDLSQVAHEFIESLMVAGIEASFDRIYNDQFARLVVIKGEKRAGLFDLYHTKKKPMSPYLHDFKDEALKSRVESAWRDFKRGSGRAFD